MATKDEIQRDEKGRFTSFTPEAPFTKKDMEDQSIQPAPISQPTPASDFAKALRQRSAMMYDAVPLYRPSDNIFVSASGITSDSRPSLEDLWALSNIRIGPAWFVTYIMAADVVRNWHQFVDPDTRKPIKNKQTDAMLTWAKKSDLRNQMHQLVRYERAMGTAFLVKYWTKHDRDVMSEEPPSGPPRKFRAFSPRYMTPINLSLNQAGELNYNEDIWRFSGGVIPAYDIHQDRVHPLCTRPEEGSWRGLSVHEPVWLSEIGYMQSFIDIVKKFRQWGSVVPAWYAKGFQAANKDVALRYIDLLNEYTNELKFVLNNEDKLVFQETKIGKGIKEAHEEFKEDMSSAWRVPLNQLFGRSMGGGLSGAGALVSKEDLLQEESNIQMSLTDDMLKIYATAGWDIENYDLEWLMAIRKTDEQKLREEGMELQNKILKVQWQNQKLQNKMLQQQIVQQEQQEIMGVMEGIEGEEPPIEGEGLEGLTEQLKKRRFDFKRASEMGYDECIKSRAEKIRATHPDLSEAEVMKLAKERCTSRPTRRNMDFWRSIRIDNHINFPYKDPDTVIYKS